MAINKPPPLFPSRSDLSMLNFSAKEKLFQVSNISHKRLEYNKKNLYS